MKNYFKFIVAIVGITFATFVSIRTNAKQKEGSKTIVCSPGDGECERTSNGTIILGHYE